MRRVLHVVIVAGLMAGWVVWGAGRGMAQEEKPAAAETAPPEASAKSETKREVPAKAEAPANKADSPSDLAAPTIPPEVQEKLEKARRAVAEAIVAAQDAGLVETSIDPPPILDILIRGYALDARTLKDPSAKKTHWAVTPEVFCGWFTGYGKLEGVTINPQTDIRIINPSAGLKQWFDQRASMLNRHLEEVRKAMAAPPAKPADDAEAAETKPAEPAPAETPATEEPSKP